MFLASKNVGKDIALYAFNGGSSIELLCLQDNQDEMAQVLGEQGQEL